MGNGKFSGGGFTMTVTGIDELLGQLANMSGAGQRAGQKGLEESAKDMLETSKDLVPVDTGALQASGHVEVSGDGDVRIVYDEDYAAIVHEKMKLKHPSGQAKYLEDAVNLGLGAMDNTLADVLDSELADSL